MSIPFDMTTTNPSSKKLEHKSMRLDLNIHIISLNMKTENQVEFTKVLFVFSFMRGMLSPFPHRVCSLSWRKFPSGKEMCNALTTGRHFYYLFTFIRKTKEKKANEPTHPEILDVLVHICKDWR